MEGSIKISGVIPTNVNSVVFDVDMKAIMGENCEIILPDNYVINLFNEFDYSRPPVGHLEQKEDRFQVLVPLKDEEGRDMKMAQAIREGIENGTLQISVGGKVFERDPETEAVTKFKLQVLGVIPAIKDEEE